MTRVLMAFIVLLAGCGTLPRGGASAVEFRTVHPRLAVFGPVLAVKRAVDERPESIGTNGGWRVLVPLLADARRTDSHPEHGGSLEIDVPADFQQALVNAAAGALLFSEVVDADADPEYENQQRWVLQSRLTRLQLELTTTSYRCGFLMTPFWLLGVPTGHVTTRLDLVVTITSPDGSERWEGLIHGQRKRVRALWFHRDSGAIVAEDVASIFAEGWYARRAEIAALVGDER